MMNRSSWDRTITFTSYGSFHPLNYFFFTLVFIYYILSVFCNVFLMLVIYFDSSLHKPMYIFLFNLAAYGLIGTTAVWPMVMENLLSETQSSSMEGCLIQIYWVYLYFASIYTTFSVMAYDRYVSICKPLQYHSIMTPGTVKTLLTVANVVPSFTTSILVYLTSRQQLCRYTVHRLICDNLAVVKLACVKSALLDLYGIFTAALLIGFPSFAVLFSYATILNVSLKASRSAQKKALSTCSPHLISFINFSLATVISLIYNRYSAFLPGYVHIIMVINTCVIPPLLHPIIYGIRTQEIRNCVAKIVKKNLIFFF